MLRLERDPCPPLHLVAFQALLAVPLAPPQVVCPVQVGRQAQATLLEDQRASLVLPPLQEPHAQGLPLA